MRALVIGADGFAGRWLLRHLVESGDSMVAIVGPNFKPPLDGADRIEQVDVRDADALAGIIVDARPDVVFDLAGISRKGDREDAAAAVGVSVVGSMNAFLACARVTPPARMLFVSTAYVYAAASEPRDEESPVEPDSIYASAKLAAERALITLAPSLGVDVVVVRPFNHIGPGQAEAFLIPTLARQIAGALGHVAATSIRVADSSIVRDYTDVRDVVRAYRVLALLGEPGRIYNVASGRGMTVADVARVMASAAGISVTVETNGAPTRDEASIMIGNPGRIQSLGWRPDRSLETTLGDVLNEALSEAGHSSPPKRWTE